MTRDGRWVNRHVHALPRREPLARLLVDAVSGTRHGEVPVAGYSGVTPPALGEALVVHKVGPAVYLHLKGADGVDPALVEIAKRMYVQQVARQIQVGADVAELAPVLGDLHVAWAAVKGPVLAEHLWPRSDMRQYSDLDIVVDRRRLGDVMDALLAHGAVMVDVNWPVIRDMRRGEVSMRLRNGTMLDLHWHLVNSPVLRGTFRFAMDALLARTVEAKIGNTVVPTLDPVDTLLHLAYHTAHSGGHRLVWLKDLECASAAADLDWDAVAVRGSQYGVLTALGVCLARVERTIGGGVPWPAPVRRAMRSPWSRIAAAGDRLWAAPRLPSDRLSGQIVYKSVRVNSRASAMAALVSSVNRPPLRRSPGSPPENILYTSAGDEKVRADYLRAVAHEETQ